MRSAEGDTAQPDSPQLGLRHRPSGVNRFFTAHQHPFHEYLQHSRNVIAQARVDADLDARGKAVIGNAPFELFPANSAPQGKDQRFRRGILLIHGLSDSPYFMRDLAAFFQENGFRVMAILLPGHGTRPGDLLDVDWREWQKTVEYGVGQLALEVDELYLGGYSAGGALSVHQSLRDARVRGLFLFAPALKVSARAAFANMHKAYSWLKPSAKWLSVHADEDRYKYESFPKNAAAQMYALTQTVQKQLLSGRVRIPVYAVVSQDDATVDTSATVAFMSSLPHPANRLVYYFSDAEKIPAGLPEQNVEWVSGIVPAQNIIGSAHTAIVLSPEDAYYGARGEYRNCLHYRTVDTARYHACVAGGEDIVSGEITEKNLGAGTLRRLMYNPNFAVLCKSMQRFIAGLPE